MGTSFRVSSGFSALDVFEPIRDAVLGGGECLRSMIPGEAGPRMTVYFPSRHEPETMLILVQNSAGTILRYSEVRGVPNPKHISELDEQMHGMERTHIQLDYVRDDVFVGNMKPGEPGVGARGTIDEFKRANIVPDVNRRIELIREICGAAKPS